MLVPGQMRQENDERLQLADRLDNNSSAAPFFIPDEQQCSFAKFKCPGDPGWNGADETVLRLLREQFSVYYFLYVFISSSCSSFFGRFALSN